MPQAVRSVQQAIKEFVLSLDPALHVVADRVDLVVIEMVCPIKGDTRDIDLKSHTGRGDAQRLDDPDRTENPVVYGSVDHAEVREQRPGLLGLRGAAADGVPCLASPGISSMKFS